MRGHFVYKYSYQGEIIYIGKCDANLETRIYQHTLEEQFKPYKECEISYIELANKTMSDVVESELIHRYMPRLNRAKKSKWEGNLPFVEPEWKKFEKIQSDSKDEPKKHKRSEIPNREKTRRLNAVAFWLDHVMPEYQKAKPYIDKDGLYTKTFFFSADKWEELKNFEYIPMTVEFKVKGGWMCSQIIEILYSPNKELSIKLRNDFLRTMIEAEAMLCENGHMYWHAGDSWPRQKSQNSEKLIDQRYTAAAIWDDFIVGDYENGEPYINERGKYAKEFRITASGNPDMINYVIKELENNKGAMPGTLYLKVGENRYRTAVVSEYLIYPTYSGEYKMVVSINDVLERLIEAEAMLLKTNVSSWEA